MLKTLVLEVGVWGCNCTPNVLIEWKSGQNLLKFGQNVCKLPQNRCMLFWINKNGTQNGNADICFGDHVLLFIFSVKLGEIWAKMVLEVGKLLSLFFGIHVLCVSSVFCYLASFWEYRIDNLRVFSVSPLQAWECFQVFTKGVWSVLIWNKFNLFFGGQFLWSFFREGLGEFRQKHFALPKICLLLHLWLKILLEESYLPHMSRVVICLAGILLLI